MSVVVYSSNESKSCSLAWSHQTTRAINEDTIEGTHLQNHFIWLHGNVGDVGVRHKAEQVEREVGRPPERQEGTVAVANEPLVLGAAGPTHPFHHLSRQLADGLCVNSWSPPSHKEQSGVKNTGPCIDLGNRTSRGDIPSWEEQKASDHGPE